MDAEVPDERLLARARDGDLASFNVLVERYERAVYNLCYRLLGRREPAEDATQEAFLSAFKGVHAYAGGNVRSWLLRIAANECKDELRRRVRKDRADSLDVMFDSEEHPVEVADPNEAVEMFVLRQEEAETIQRLLLTLTFEQREAIVLVDLYDYHYEEVATMTGASVGTVKSRIHRGREKLRQAIEADGELSGLARRLGKQVTK
jgi:RNA polymerase sigma-70 factor (ECF subfamily)